jgi:hypothetical protein
MSDEIKDEALNALRTIVWEMDELVGRLQDTLSKAKAKLAYIDALEKDKDDSVPAEACIEGRQS